MPRPAEHVAKRLKMRELERVAGVGRESIRYYIREGLLPEPQRPGRNVAWYDESFVERIRLIKELQQKRYLPLQVIKAIVNGDSPPSPVEAATLGLLDGKVGRPEDGSSSTPRERLSALAARTGIPSQEIRQLAEIGFLPLASGRDPWIDGEAIPRVELWAKLRAAGFTEERGFDASQARVYVDMVQVVAREELRLFTNGLAGRVAPGDLVQMAKEGIEIGTEIIAQLHRAALLRLISDATQARTPRRTKRPRLPASATTGRRATRRS